MRGRRSQRQSTRGGAPFPGMQKHRFPQVRITSNLAPSFGTPLSSCHTFDCAAWCGACCASRAADGGSAGAADGSSAAALALVAALAEHPHAQVAARPLNAPTAKPHATLQPSPATVTADGLPRHPSQISRLRMQWPALGPLVHAGRERHASRVDQVCAPLPSAWSMQHAVMHGVDALPMHALHLMSCLLAAGAAVASHRGHFRVRDFGRVYALPPPQLPPTQLPTPLRRSKRIGHGTLYVAPRHAALADMSNLAAALQ